MPRGQYRVPQTAGGQTVYQSNVGNVGAKGQICHICGMEFKETECVLWRGKWYGIPCTDYKDIPYIRGDFKRS